MKDHTILVTGEYWHPDFQFLLRKLDVPITMVPIQKITSVNQSHFDLILIVEARRNQVCRDDVEALQAMFVGVPMVALLGSWCEGEPRSGAPWPGVIRVYWHQWEGRYDRFVSQLQQAGITDWHAPLTSTVADRMARQSTADPDSAATISCIGISAWTHSQFEMLADAMNHFGWHSRWVERSMWNGATTKLVSAICVDADGWTPELENRLKWLREEIPETPMVLLLNYPRHDELDSIRQAGILGVISKPFELGDLKSAIERAVKQHHAIRASAHASTD